MFPGSRSCVVDFRTEIGGICVRKWDFWLRYLLVLEYEEYECIARLLEIRDRKLECGILWEIGGLGWTEIEIGWASS